MTSQMCSAHHCPLSWTDDYSPEAAIDDEKDRNEEGGHLAGVNKGVCPEEREREIQT